MTQPLVVGLTGPIGCGKSTVARWLAEDGAIVIDADQVARMVTAPGQAGHDLVLERFGPAFRREDGSLDRAALGRHVFADPAALADLEAIVHPLVRPEILAALDDARRRGAPAVVIEAIKLIESGYGEICDDVWLVTCPPDEQQRRLVARGLAPAEAAQRATAQAGMAERLMATGAVTRTLDTAGSKVDVRDAVRTALRTAIARHANVSGDLSGSDAGSVPARATESRAPGS